MSSASLLQISLCGAYKERPQEKEGKFERAVRKAIRLWPDKSVLRHYQPMLKKIANQAAELEAIGEESLRLAFDDAREKMLGESFTADKLADLFAVLREVCGRTLGKRHFDVQMIGAAVMLEGGLAEMQTGEGKTLTAALAAAAAAVTGEPVHVISVNDYLVERDAEQLSPFFQWLGLSVGTIIEGMEIPERQRAYACDICYCSNKELVFDYLKDRITLKGSPSPIPLQVERIYGQGGRTQDLILRGLHFAIVDEADSVLIDEARVPCIISRTASAEGQEAYMHQAVTLARNLTDSDYVLHKDTRRVMLTDSGRFRLIDLGEELGGLWRRVQWREQSVIQALSALYLYEKDEHYLVDDDKVQIIDEFTGRTMADRSWEHGLHQMIEAKENVTITGEREAIAKISYQAFFRRYLRLSGMTGTAEEVRGELEDIYRLKVRRIPTNKPNQRKFLPDQYFLTQREKWQAVAARVTKLNRSGRPILVGTRSVADSETLSALFSDQGIAHELLNARQNAEEAEIIALAGQPFRVTIATNMAGRGTDIEISEVALNEGGLHVIATEFHEAARIDRQLFGRAARQGDMGSCEVFASLEDSLVRQNAGLIINLLIKFFGKRYPQLLGSFVLRRLQRRVEKAHSNIRASLLDSDEQLENLLAFSGSKQ